MLSVCRSGAAGSAGPSESRAQGRHGASFGAAGGVGERDANNGFAEARRQETAANPLDNLGERLLPAGGECREQGDVHRAHPAKCPANTGPAKGNPTVGHARVRCLAFR
jgi:hypothetical protein